MEPLGFGAFPDGEWDCFQRIFAIEGHGCLPQFLDHSSLQLGEEDGNTGMLSMFSSTPESERNESMFYSFDAHDSSLQYISQENSHSSNSSGRNTVFMANPAHTNSYFGNADHVPENDTCTPMDFYMMDDEKNPGSFVPSPADTEMEENISLNEEERSDRSENSDHGQVEPIVIPAEQLQLKRKLDMPELEVPEEDKININSCGDQKKKPRVSEDVHRCMNNARSKKNQKLDRNKNEVEETNSGSDGQGSSSYTSSGDDNANQENSGGATSASKSPAALNLNGKTRASRGSATDPRSLYARKRRERINERLRILQNLVPNGTKVDISTMLEEAVQYVKFLQLQIKLLSSDDLDVRSDSL